MIAGNFKFAKKKKRFLLEIQNIPLFKIVQYLKFTDIHNGNVHVGLY